jgi:hypothetical protein
VLLPFTFAEVVPNGNEQSVKKSNSSLTNSSKLDEIPIITNEADYAEFQKQRELAVRSSSSSSKKSNISSSASSTVSSISKQSKPTFK